MIKCPICNFAEINKWSVNNKYYYCNQCIFAWKIKKTINNYTEDYYQPESFVINILLKHLWNYFYDLRIKYYGKKIKELWIDIGSGDGLFLKRLDLKKVLGVENSKKALLIMQSNHINNMEVSKFKNSKIQGDVISFWHSLEHVDNPGKYLEIAFYHLQKNGRLIIGIPNINSFETNIFKKYWFHLAPLDHNYHFSDKSLQILLSRTKLKVESVDYVAFEHHLSGIVQSTINYISKTYNLLHSKVKRGNQTPEIHPVYYFWVIICITIGLPFILLLFFIQVWLKKSGAIVITARKASK